MYIGASSNLDWTQSSWATTSNTTLHWYPQAPALAPVLDSPAASLNDREWLDAQIAEVCELAMSA